MTDIIEYADKYHQSLVDMILHIQQSEYHIPISMKDQPDLNHIGNFYQKNGNFWIAVDGNDVVGSVALKNIGNGDAALRKMFVKKDYRGKDHGVSQGLLHGALDWSRRNNFNTLYLGTTPQFLAAHRFYEKNGFVEIGPEALPETFPVMEVDKKFYRYDLK
jgi:GNAT superfamily N-acetyltransferase